MQSIDLKRYNLSNIFNNYSHYLSAVNTLSRISKKNYLSDVRYFIHWYGCRGITEPNDSLDFIIGYHDFEAYCNHLVESNLPFRSVNRKLSSLRNFFDYCFDNKLIKENYARRKLNLTSSSVILPQLNLDQFSPIEQKDIDEFISIIRLKI